MATVSSNSLSGTFYDIATMPAQGEAHQLWHADQNLVSSQTSSDTLRSHSCSLNPMQKNKISY